MGILMPRWVTIFNFPKAFRNKSGTSLHMLAERYNRMGKANELISFISKNGRNFFRSPSKDGADVAHFLLSDNGRVWFLDAYTRKKIYTHYNGRWRGFSEGGTMRRLVEYMRDFIRTGQPIHQSQLGPWPEWTCGGDLWGYGDDMELVREKAAALGML
jgi:hypothetical protein